MNFSFHDNRRHNRLKVKLPVTYSITGPNYVIDQVGSEKFQSITIDLNVGGISLYSNQYIPEGTKLFLQFELFNDVYGEHGYLKESISVSGEIASVVFIERDKYRLGICFGPVNEETEGKFYDLICFPHKYKD